MTELSFLQINDLHGYVAPHLELIRTDAGDWQFATLGGLARIATIFDEVRAEAPGSVIALDNGDTFHGTHLAVSSRGHALVPMLNALDLDAMAVHWEFAFGPKGVEELAASLKHPVLAINCHRKADDQLLFPPYRMIERQGLRIAIIGIACPIVNKTMPPPFSEGVYFTIGDRELPRWIAHVRGEERADLVVVLSHLGFPQDVKLAELVDGIDVLVSGHTHNRMEHAIVVNGAIIFQSGCHGSFVGRLDIKIADGKIASHRHRLIPVADTLAEQGEMQTLVSDALQREPRELQQVVGTVTARLHRYAMLSSPMDDVLLEAISDAAGTRIAFSNGWRYGAPIAPGPVTLNDLWNIIPTNPPVSVVELTGEEMVEMLEANLERTFAADPFEQMGGYVKRMRGVRMYFKAENPSGHRIDRLYAEDEPIDLHRSYTVAFVTAQGVPIKFGRNRRKLEIDAISALKALFAKRGTVTPDSTETVVEV
jgi:2',3'-cyclic-nucleotide 2'-phosphodiesterase (5'-nucleotidase family)